MTTSEEFDEFLDEVEADYVPYDVQFALGMPIIMERVEDWTALQHLEVHARAHQAWVAWISDTDPVTEMEWELRPYRMMWKNPMRAAWEFVDWHIARRLGPWVLDEDMDVYCPDDYEEPEEDDGHDDSPDAEAVLADLRSTRVA